MKDKTKLLILFGGVSSEHEVSRVSASSILTHINGEKYEIYTLKELLPLGFGSADLQPKKA